MAGSNAWLKSQQVKPSTDPALAAASLLAHGGFGLKESNPDLPFLLLAPGVAPSPCNAFPVA